MFLPLTLIFYYGLARIFNANIAKYFLIFASLIFYSYWDIKNVPVLFVSILVNYVIAHFLEKKRKKLLLALGVAFNIIYLGYFKYTDFIISNIDVLLGMNIPLYHITLPLGISFFTFTQTAYLVDVYRGETKEYSKSDYLLFVTIFPHLIAGPILYHKDMIPQFSKLDNYKLNYKNLYNGILWFIIGMFKKVIIADKLAVYANNAFNNVDKLTMLDAWGGSLAYTLQLYFDFCGYSEMAMGLGLMLNYNLPLNFNLPYRACSIIDFWRRWHMTLSAFLKNYLYIPLGGNRYGHHMRNIMATMLLGGLWHGAGWTFVMWGGTHGAFICINHLWRKTNIKLPRFLCWLLTFNAVNLAWIFFRADSFSQATNFIAKLVDFNLLYAPRSSSVAKYIPAFDSQYGIFNLHILLTILGFLLLSVLVLDKSKLEKLNDYVLATGLSIVAIYLIASMGRVSEFLYFQF